MWGLLTGEIDNDKVIYVMRRAVKTTAVSAKMC